MAPLSFLKSDKEKEKDRTAIMPDSVSPSKYHPSRLLRRKSTKSVVLDTDAASTGTSSGPPTGSTSWTFVEPQSQPVPQEMDSPVYERFGGRRGSEPGSNSKRSGGVYERSGEDGGVVVIDAGIPGMSRRIADQQTFFSTIETPVRSQSPPMYPTALSPPRRPLPRSPHAQQNTWNPTSPGSDMLQRFSSHDAPSTTGPASSSSEWLKRKPSGGRLRNDLHSARASPLPRKPLQGAAHIRHTSFSSMEPDAETSSAESDGEIGIGRPARRRPQVRGDGSAYEVEVLCVDDRVASDEMKWEVTIRRRDQRTGLNGSSTSPLQISTSSSIAQAPSSAGSINLSLSLDQPTGKLVFIAFPMDIHATPTRRRRPSAATTSTPPPPSTTPPPAPNLAASSPTTPSSHRKGATSMWPSPRENGVGGGGHVRSPSSSPRDVFTPRRSRIVSASQLEGGLYGKATPDGMSEDMEAGLSITEAVALRGQIERN